MIIQSSKIYTQISWYLSRVKERMVDVVRFLIYQPPWFGVSGTHDMANVSFIPPGSVYQNLESGVVGLNPAEDPPKID